VIGFAAAQAKISRGQGREQRGEENAIHDGPPKANAPPAYR
jgi:hypothetical protein